MKDFAFELAWTLFWVAWAVVGIVFHWPVLVIVILFALAGFIYIDGDIF